MGKKLLGKASLVPGVRQTASPEVNPLVKPRTAPGTMMTFMSAQSDTLAENEQLRDRVVELERGERLRELDPAVIAPSRWANRHDTSFRSAEFESLKADISAAKGNVQPIRVRRAPGRDDGTEFELIYGHRRHRACAELGLPVLAQIVDATDQELFEQMERENRSRSDLSAWEQGAMYRRALDDGLYPSLRQLAESLDVDPSLVSKSVALARLPVEVVSAFERPMDIQFRWAAPLTAAVEKDAAALIAKATKLARDGSNRTAKQVFELLVGQAAGGAEVRELTREGRAVGRFTSDPKKGATLTIRPEALDKDVLALIDKLVARVSREAGK
jgi:ParB family chromosome partitioning protein